MRGILQPASEYSRDIAGLALWMFGVAALVWIAVTVAVLWAIRPRPVVTRGIGEAHAPLAHRRAMAGIAIATALTVVILIVFMAFDFVIGRAHAQPHDPLRPGGALSVTVVGRQWWWEFIYDDTVPERRLSTANELHIAAGVPVLLALRSPDVIHSVWVPRLAGKQDLTPGYLTALRFTADTPGVYTGVCAEFCGAQHANMRFQVVAHTPDGFARWRAHEASPALPIPASDTLRSEGRSLFMAGTCAACHTIAGTDARGTVGPVLTHVGSRRTIGANTLPNTDANMAAWIRNPQAIKPGTQMPSSNLPEPALQAIVAYLRTLK